MDLLMDYAWPGNIRELQNIIERAVVLSTGPVLTVDPAFLPRTSAAAEVPKTALAVRQGLTPKLRRTMHRRWSLRSQVLTKWNAIISSLL